ncbi:MAG: 16S rRNA (cytosine(967)-C(5))-methyltransferase RsmB [Terracidiphilus sp.]
MHAVSPARAAAFSILDVLEKGKGHSDDLLRGRSVAELSESDRHLTTALVLGVLRWQIDLDRRVLPLLKHPNAKLDAEVLIALRLGAFQLLHMDRIPVHAAIDESVELAKRAGHRFASGMVNAVLRKVAASRTKGEGEASAERDWRRGFPEWMVARWTTTYGEEAAGAICRQGQSQPKVTVPADNAAMREELASAGIELEAGRILTKAFTVASGDITASAPFREGRVRLQDEGSQLVAELVPRSKAILDCCAAPGGKTLILAERNPDARIVACEVSPQRLERLQERLAGLGERVECRLADVTALEEEAQYDAVLADVPCSGTGTLGRNPEIRHRLQLSDLRRQAERQGAILRAALRAAKPGGFVIYSTCSLEPEENEEIVAAVLAEDSNARLVPLRARIEELRCGGVLSAWGAENLLPGITTEGNLRLLPGMFESDGFFVAMIEKKA